MVEYLIRGSLLHNDTGIHEYYPAGNLFGKHHLMGNDHHRHPVFCQGLDNLQYLADHFRIQRGCGLVKQQQLRLHAKCPGNGHALFLTSGQLRRPGVNISAHAYLLQVFLRGLFCLCLVLLIDDLHADHAVFQYVHVGKQVKGLEHHTYPGTEPVLILGFIGNLLALEHDLAAGGLLQHIDTAKQCGFTGTGGTDHTDYLTFFHIKMNILEHLMAAEAFAKVTHL